MAQAVRPDSICQAAVDGVAAYGSVNAAARAAKVPEATFRKRYQDGMARGLTAPEPVRTEPPVQELFTSFEEAWAQWQREIGMMRERYQGPACLDHLRESQAGLDSGDNLKQRIVVLPDLHVPFHEAGMLAELIARESGHVDRCICIGDLGDSYALSRFTKYERMPYRDEWARVTLVMQTLSESFPQVDIVIGNHDARLEKQLRERLSEDMVDAVSCITGGVLCPITALAKRYPNVQIAKHTIPSGHTVDWFTTVGDAWLGHPEKFSRVPGSALRSVEEWIADNEATLGLEDFRLIVMGHTHTYALLPWRAHKLLVECGCLCQQQGYMVTPRIGGRPQRRGYLTFTQTNGRTDLNSVKFHCFDWLERAA